MTNEEMQAMILRLQAENEALKTRKVASGGLKITEKGGLSLYGLGRFPTTLYKGQWLKLLERADEIKTFIAENDSKLSDKAPTKE